MIQYLRKHQSPTINYQVRQPIGGSVGSGVVESLIKQIGLRIKSPGAQWLGDHLPRYSSVGVHILMALLLLNSLRVECDR